MAGPRYVLTADYQQKVCASVRDGVRPATASEAAGIPRQVMARWVRAGRSPRALPRYREFAAALTGARGRAKVEPQMKTFRTHPQEWGRDQRDRRKARRAQNPGGGMPKGENLYGVADIFEVMDAAREALAGLPGALEALGSAMAKYAGPGVDEALSEVESPPEVPAGDDEKHASAVHPVYNGPTSGPHPVPAKCGTMGDDESQDATMGDTRAAPGARKNMCAAAGPQGPRQEAGGGSLPPVGDGTGAVPAHRAYRIPTCVTPEYATIGDDESQDATMNDSRDAREAEKNRAPWEWYARTKQPGSGETSHPLTPGPSPPTTGRGEQIVTAPLFREYRGEESKQVALTLPPRVRGRGERPTIRLT